MSDNLPAPGDSQIVIYQADSGTTRLEVRLQDETVWLTQNLMAELYQTTKQNISLHIQNIYEEGELDPEATVKKYLTVRTEGARTVKRPLDYYNLDMIIAVGYRVKSGVACTAPGSLDTSQHYAASASASSRRAWAGLRNPIFSISHS
jgi:hypothetical protein